MGWLERKAAKMRKVKEPSTEMDPRLGVRLCGCGALFRGDWHCEREVAVQNSTATPLFDAECARLGFVPLALYSRRINGAVVAKVAQLRTTSGECSQNLTLVLEAADGSGRWFSVSLSTIRSVASFLTDKGLFFSRRLDDREKERLDRAWETR
jgi:hypothetical protein